MMILSTAMLLTKAGPDKGKKDAREGGTTPTASTKELGDLVATTDGEKRDYQKTLSRSLATERISFGGDQGIRAFLLKIAGTPLKDAQIQTRMRVGGQIDPAETRRHPFVAKRTPTGDVELTIDGDPLKLKRRYEGFYLVSPDRSHVLSEGILEGNKVIFPDSKNAPSNALIVRQSASVIGGSWLAAAERKIIGMSLTEGLARRTGIESLSKRSQFCNLGQALIAGDRAEGASKKAV